MKKVWSFFTSTRLTVILAIVICLNAAWGSILAVKNPGFFRALDRMVLFPWLATTGIAYSNLTLWMYILVFLTFLFSLNTVACTADKVYSIFTSKKPLRSLFPHIVHVGFTIALLGHLAGSLWGFRSYGNLIYKGSIVPVPNEKGLSLRLDDVQVSQSPGKEMESFVTKVTLLREDTEVLTGDIEINGPLIYKGIAFYNFDQGSAPSGLLLETNGEKISIKFNGSFKTKDNRAYRLGEIYPDFAVDEKGNPYSRSNNFVNPYIEIISENGKIALLDISRPHTYTALGDKRFNFEDFTASPYVVLTINKDPGIWLIIIGSSILVAGMVLLLFFRGERAELVKVKG